MNQFNISFKQNEAKYITLYKYIKGLIVSNVLKPEEKIPSRRLLASHLNISTNTILSAYDLLLQEGYIYSKDKSGYYVSSNYNYKQVNNDTPIEQVNSEFSYQYDFTSSSIDKSLFPYYTFKKVAQDIISNNPDIWLKRASFQGDEELRKNIASYLFENKGMNVSKNNIIIVSSLEESLDIINNLINIKKVGMENPTYLKVYQFFKKQKKDIYLYSLDKEGILLNDKKQLDLIYVTPYNQFPLGIKMSNERKKELLNYSSRYILEDDFDCDLISQNKVMSTLFSLNNEKVIYHGSFSHTLCSGIRISYLVIPNNLINIYKEKYSTLSSRISSLDQALISEFLKNGYYYRHLTALKRSLNKKKQMIKEFLNNHHVSYIENELSFILTPSKNDTQLKKHLIDASINIHFISDFSIDSSDYRIILSYNAINENELENALSILIKIIA